MPICIASAILACFIFIVNVNGTLKPQQALDRQEATVQFQIIDFETKTDNGYAYLVKTQRIDIDGAPQNIKLRVKSENKIKADYYDTITGKVKFYKIAENGYQSYGYYADKIFLSSKLSSYETEKAERKPFGYYILQVREYISETLTGCLNGDNGTLAVALITGDKRNLSNKSISAFMGAGVSHLVAVSGLHLAVIIGSLFFLLKMFRAPSVATFLICMSAMIIYCSVAAFSPSVIRASIMMSVLLLGRAINKKADSLNSLGIAAFLICLNPFSVTDISFALSLTSILSLLTLSPIINQKIRVKNKALRYVFQSLCASVFVLIYTFPVIWFFYGTAVLNSIFANIILIPFAEFTMIASLLLIILSKIPVIGYLSALLTAGGTQSLLSITEFFSEHGLSALDISGAFVGIGIAAVFFIMGMAFTMKNKNALKTAAIVSVILFLFSVAFGNYQQKDKVFLRVTDNGEEASVLIYDNENAVIIGTLNKSDYYTFNRIISSKNLNLSLVLTYGLDTEYNEIITHDTPAEYFILPAKNEAALMNTNSTNILVTDTYSAKVWDCLSIEYIYTDNEHTIVLSIYDDIVVIAGQNTSVSGVADVMLCANSPSTSLFAEFEVNLEDETDNGDLIFTFEENRSIPVRRENAWLQ